MELHRDIRMLSLMHYRMISGMALISHAMRCITPCIKLPPGISMDKCTMAGMKCWILHPERTEKGTILMLHGGAFACPAAPYHLKNASAYAGTGFRVIMPDYPLLPQHPHPEALEKIIQLAMDISDLSVIAGDSAGGFLALRTALEMHPAPPMMLIYPVVSPEETDSWKKYPDTPMWSGTNNRWMWRKYLRNQELKAIDYSPAGKAFIETAEFDPLHDEGVKLYEELRRNGADAVLSETKGTVHGYDFLWKKPLAMEYIGRRLSWLGNL